MNMMSESRDDQGRVLVDRELVLIGVWIAQLVRDRLVLDASSWIGPATRELLEAARELVVATPRTAISDAIGDLVSPEVRAYCTPLAQLPFDSDSFDAIVSLEVRDLENLDETVNEFSRVLKPETGILVLSTILDSRDPSDTNVVDKLFRPILSAKFSNVTTVTYTPYLTAGFFAADGSHTSAEMPPDGVLGGPSVPADVRPSNRLVVGSPRPLDSYTLPNYVSLPFEIAQLQTFLQDLTSRVRGYEARARTADQLSDENAGLLRKLFSAEQAVAQAFDQRARRDELTLLSAGSEEELSEIRRQLFDARAHIEALQATLSWRVTRPLRTLRRLLR